MNLMEATLRFDVSTWERNISSQFPVADVQQKNDDVVLGIGPPHEGYTICTQIKEGQLDGDAVLRLPDNSVIGKFQFHKGSITGTCQLYYESGSLFYEGYLHDGWREGIGKEYNEFGEVIYEGYFEKGKKRNDFIKMEMNGVYWKEQDELGNIISICQKDEFGNNCNLCYFFSLGQIDRESICKDNKEVEVLKRFRNGKMIEYCNGIRCFEGFYTGSIDTGFSRVSGCEFDKTGEIVIYDGNYLNGVRHAYGTTYDLKGNVTYDGTWIKGMKWIWRFLIVYSLAILCSIACFFLIIAFCKDAFYFYLNIISLLCLTILILYFLFPKVGPPTAIDLQPQSNYDLNLKRNGEVTLTFNNYLFKKLHINGFSKMKHLTILYSPDNSNFKKRYAFDLMNCEDLITLSVASKALERADVFRISNLPMLQSIHIGSKRSLSSNFLNSSFIIEGFLSLMIDRT